MHRENGTACLTRDSAHLQHELVRGMDPLRPTLSAACLAAPCPAADVPGPDPAPPPYFRAGTAAALHIVCSLLSSGDSATEGRDRRADAASFAACFHPSRQPGEKKRRRRMKRRRRRRMPSGEEKAPFGRYAASRRAKLGGAPTERK